MPTPQRGPNDRPKVKKDTKPVVAEAVKEPTPNELPETDQTEELADDGNN